MSIRRDCYRVRKKIIKIIRKMFGYKTFREAYMKLSCLVDELEYGVGKEIDKFDNDDILKYPNRYSEYLTLKKLTDLYIEMNIFELELGDRYGH